MKFDIRDVISWAALIFALVMLLWYVFGNSPTEFFTLVAILVAIAARMESIAVKMARVETRMNYFERGFSALAKDFKHHIKHK